MRWKGRFIESGLHGLMDKPRTGRPTHLNSAFKKAVLEKFEQEPPEGSGQWDGALLAQELGLAKHSVWKLLRMERIRLARKLLKKLVQGREGHVHRRNGTISLLTALEAASGHISRKVTSPRADRRKTAQHGGNTVRYFVPEVFAQKGLQGHGRTCYNETAKSFVWQKREVKDSQLENNARNFNN
ncbi:helix-turn-helix domain-containing protein [Candidatus Desulfovibrio trichonymphae]|uniref:helix-turn-helix domain-containing protein n=1 Tax=Candidatus Desulfovibrio trichonymphae TaxID=1725232 RepID=UPI000BBB4050|nr:hypothetical protein AGMMS50248_03660 [Deltaproteobacteria bacterium]